MNIANETAEIAAIAIMESTYDDIWECLSDDLKNEHRAAARAALESVMPQMLAEAFDAGFTTCAGEFSKQRKDPNYPINRINPYRSQA